MHTILDLSAQRKKRNPTLCMSVFMFMDGFVLNVWQAIKTDKLEVLQLNEGLGVAPGSC